MRTLRAEMPSKMHKQAWKKFLDLLRVRDTITFNLVIGYELSLIL